MKPRRVAKTIFFAHLHNPPSLVTQLFHRLALRHDQDAPCIDFPELIQNLSNLIEMTCLIHNKIKLVIVPIDKRIGKEDVNILGEIVPADFDLVSGGGSSQSVNFRLFSSVRPRA